MISSATGLNNTWFDPINLCNTSKVVTIGGTIITITALAVMIVLHAPLANDRNPGRQRLARSLHLGCQRTVVLGCSIFALGITTAWYECTKEINLM